MATTEARLRYARKNEEFDLRRAFAALDINKDSRIDADDLAAFFNEVGHKVKKSEVEDLIWEVDEDCDQAVDWEEFQKTYQRCNKDTTGLEPRGFFNVVQFIMSDREGKGSVSLQEAMQLVYLRYGRAELDGQLEAVFGTSDLNSGKTLSLTEFLLHLFSNQIQWRSSQPKRGWHHTIPPLPLAGVAAVPQQAVAEMAAGPLGDIAGVTIAGGVVAGVAWSLLPLLSGRAQERRAAARRGAAEEDDETVQWSVMGVVSCIPLINWTAWVFAALESEAPAGYYGLALLYALPWLTDGLRADAFTVCCLLAGIAHVQIERIAATEPETLPVAGSGALRSAAEAGRRQLEDSLSSFKDVVDSSAEERKRDVEEVTTKSQVGRLERDSRKLLSSEEQAAKEQMQLWDERLQERRGTEKSE